MGVLVGGTSKDDPTFEPRRFASILLAAAHSSIMTSRSAGFEHSRKVLAIGVALWA